MLWMIKSPIPGPPENGTSSAAEDGTFSTALPRAENWTIRRDTLMTPGEGGNDATRMQVAQAMFRPGDGRNYALEVAGALSRQGRNGRPLRAGG
jgi:hypothetical protein